MDTTAKDLLATCKAVASGLEIMEQMAREVVKDNALANLAREKRDWLIAAIEKAETAGSSR